MATNLSTNIGKDSPLIAPLSKTNNLSSPLSFGSTNFSPGLGLLNKNFENTIIKTGDDKGILSSH